VLVLVLDLLAIRAEKRARSFRNCSVPASVAAEAAVFLDYEHEHKHKHDFVISRLGLAGLSRWSGRFRGGCYDGA